MESVLFSPLWGGWKIVEVNEFGYNKIGEAVIPHSTRRQACCYDAVSSVSPVLYTGETLMLKCLKAFYPYVL
jgi:hypothetical protein